ncbi:MAG: exodeoxyribonuclease VII small subunit [Phycisphaeraceae bacterium]|nr:exodeoxyribonuclease VII small subunit [Phycisphaeraceae bacterium]
MSPTRQGSGEKGATGDAAEPAFEEALARVEAIIERIEGGEVGLEESLAQYEKGVEMIRRCRVLLERAEQKVEELTAKMKQDRGGE